MAKSAYAYRQNARRRGWYRFCRALAILILMAAAGGAGFLYRTYRAVTVSLPLTEELATIYLPVPTRILASDGTLLGKIHRPGQNRDPVDLSEMGDYLPRATVAVEDERFYQHMGVDPRGIARALYRNARAGRVREGASTITQQLARGLYLTPRQTLSRKLQEMLLAVEIERKYSKDEILETYLNQVYYGSNPLGLHSYGAQMAARNYFGKDVAALTLGQAALLAGLPQSPTRYSPYAYPDAARARRNVVLAQMLNAGLVTKKEYQAAHDETVVTAKPKPVPRVADSYAPYFVSYVLRHEMEEVARVVGLDRERMIYGAGLVIHTSLDPRMQKVAEDSLISAVKKNARRKIEDGCLVAIDQKTGYIKAMVGGTQFDGKEFNVVTQGYRQPGSAFKPFVYATALLRGYRPTTRVLDEMHRYPMGDGKYWVPKNSDGGYRGAIPLRQALWGSRNAAAVRIAEDVGIRSVIETAYTMGIPRDARYPLDPVLATALGASVVLPLDICSAYCTIANSGVHNPTAGIVRVTSAGGEVIYDHKPHPTRGLPADIADDLKDLMRGVIERGTGRAARCAFPASGKTGTTNSYCDAWFIGFSDDLCTAVWVGNNSNKPMNRIFGGTVPAPVWKEFMTVAHPIMAAEHEANAAELSRMPRVSDDVPQLERTESKYITDTRGRGRAPATDETAAEEPAPGTPFRVRLCQDSGELAGPGCTNTADTEFRRGEEPGPPTATCTLHGGTDPQRTAPRASTPDPALVPAGTAPTGIHVRVCAESGKIATDACPEVVVRRFARDPPRDVCPLHPE